MWRVEWIRGRDSTDARARRFMDRWDVVASADDELRFQPRGRILTLAALHDAMERVVPCSSGCDTRIVFDLSGVEEIESCYSVICAHFIRFAVRVGRRCRITGLNPRLAGIVAFFLRHVGLVELEPAQPSAAAAS